MNLFDLSTFALGALIVVALGGTVACGVLAGHRLRDRESKTRESVGVVQAALLGLIGLLLAFGLSMAVGRYENRRSLVVKEGNDIGTTYLRAQLLREPERGRSLDRLEQYTDQALVYANSVPGSGRNREAATTMEHLQGELWALAGDAIAADPTGSAPKLYVEALNPMFDTHSSRAASLANRVPTPVMVLLLVGSAIALGVLSLYLSLLGRGVTTSIVTCVVLVVILFVTFDLDRPERGFIQVPAAPLEQVRAGMTAD